MSQHRCFPLSTGHPQEFSVTAGSLLISLDFYALFGNVLGVSVITEKRREKSVKEKSVKEFHLTLETVSVSNKTNLYWIALLVLNFSP